MNRDFVIRIIQKMQEILRGAQDNPAIMDLFYGRESLESNRKREIFLDRYLPNRLGELFEGDREGAEAFLSSIINFINDKTAIHKYSGARRMYIPEEDADFNSEAVREIYRFAIGFVKDTYGVSFVALRRPTSDASISDQYEIYSLDDLQALASEGPRMEQSTLITLDGEEKTLVEVIDSMRIVASTPMELTESLEVLPVQDESAGAQPSIGAGTGVDVLSGAALHTEGEVEGEIDQPQHTSSVTGKAPVEKSEDSQEVSSEPAPDIAQVRQESQGVGNTILRARFFGIGQAPVREAPARKGAPAREQAQQAQHSGSNPATSQQALEPQQAKQQPIRQPMKMASGRAPAEKAASVGGGSEKSDSILKKSVTGATGISLLFGGGAAGASIFNLFS